jgi:hypothetical protein
MRVSFIYLGKRCVPKEITPYILYSALRTDLRSFGFAPGKPRGTLGILIPLGEKPSNAEEPQLRRRDSCAFGVPKGNRNQPTETHYNGDNSTPPTEKGALIHRTAGINRSLPRLRIPLLPFDAAVKGPICNEAGYRILPALRTGRLLS